VFRLIIDEFLPMVEAINVETAKVIGTNPHDELLPRGLGPISHPMGNARFERSAITFTLWKMQRLLDVYDAMSPTDQSAVRSWLTSLGGQRMLDLKVPRLRRVGVQVGLALDGRS
jgi:hypothetical protein